MLFVEIISWMRVSNAKLTSLLQMGKIAMSLGAYATMLSIFIVFRVGSRREKYALWTIPNGSSTNMDVNNSRNCFAQPFPAFVKSPVRKPANDQTSRRMIPSELN